MGTAVVRVPDATKSVIREIAKQKGTTEANVVSDAVKEMRRRIFLEAGNEAYARLRADTKASKEFDEEISDLDATLSDGLERY